MNFTVEKSIEIPEGTPKVLNDMLQNISDDWTSTNEGGDSWSAYDIIGHLIYGEKTDWMPRAEIILSGKNEKTFKPFDRFAQFEESKGKTLSQLLDEFTILWQNNIERLMAKNISDDDFGNTGIHPAFGEVTLLQLLATWVVHDLNHIAQICRVMAKQYQEEVGPWVEYLGILKQ